MSTIQASIPESRFAVRTASSGTPSNLKLDANECGPSPVSDERLDFARYPDRSGVEAVIAARAGVDPERIVATAGADDAIDRTFRTVLAPGSIVVVTDPTFPMFERFARECGAEVRSVPWQSGPLPVAELAEASADAAAIVIATPNNPTGAVASPGRIAALRAEVPDPILMVDLAYAEFDDLQPDGPAEPTFAEWCRWMPRTVMLRTLSKAWGLASLRVGWLEADEELASRVRDRGGPYPIAGTSLRVATEILGDPDVDDAVRSRVDLVTANRARMVETFRELGIAAEPSRGNFLFIRPGDDDLAASRLRQGLRGLDISVRGFEGTSMADRLRITVPVIREDLDALTDALRSVVRPDGLLFDLDGVIADVSESYRLAIRYTAASFGVEIAPGDIDEVKSAGDANDDWVVTDRLLRAAGVEADFDEIVRRFQMIYLGDGDRPGLRERERSLLDPKDLRAAVGDRPVGVVTGRPRTEAEWFLRRIGLDSMVDVLIAREDAPLKPDPRGVELALDRLGIRTAWFLGDTEDDLLAARRVRGRRVLPVGVVPTGAVDPSRLRRRLFDAGAGAIVDAGRECIEMIRRASS